MARHGGWSSANYLEYSGGAIVTAPPFTLSAWGKTHVTGSGRKQCAITFQNTALDGNNEFVLGVDGSSHVWANSQATGSGSAASTTTHPLDTWFHMAGVFTSSTSRAAYLNGGGKGTNTTSSTPASMTKTRIGFNNSPDNYPWGGTTSPSGDLAEIAVWNIALSDSDVASLANGIHPFLIHPEAIVAYWPLIGNNSPENNLKSNTATMAVQGTLSAGPHPRIFYPSLGRARKLGSTAAVARPFVNNWPSPILPAPIFPVQVQPAFVGAFPAAPPQTPYQWPAPIVSAWTPQTQLAQPLPGTLLPPFVPSSQPAPAVSAWSPRPQPPQPSPGQLLAPFRPYTWPSPVTPAWQPAQQTAQPFLGLSIVVAVPFVPYPWPAPPPAIFRPQQPPAWFNPAPIVAPGVPFLPFSWPPPKAAEFKGQQPQSWFNPTAVAAAAAPFKPFVWPRPIEARWAPQAQPSWFNPAAPSVPVEEFCPTVLTPSLVDQAHLSTSFGSSTNNLASGAVRGASLSSGVVRGSARFAPTISGRAGLTSSTRKC